MPIHYRIDSSRGITFTTRTGVLQITGGSDLSEQFDVAAAEGEVAPGLVVCIEADHAGRLLVCNKAYDRTVAGVVSGAGGIEPGMVMGQEGSPADGAYPVALTGRVYVWADASGGPIQPGDLLTTSDTPGLVMKVTDYERALGQYEADLPLRGIDPASAEGQADLARARSWILDFMITEELIVQAAEEAGVAISDEEVDAVMAEMVTENGGEEAFQAKLEEWGETYEIHWEKERRGLIVMQMSQRVADSVPTVAEHVHARHILVDIPNPFSTKPDSKFTTKTR